MPLSRRFGAFLALVALVAFALPLVACATPRTQVVPVSFVPAATAPPAPTAAAPCARAAPTAPQPVAYTAVPVQPVAVEYRTGAEEHTRAALAIPPDVAACLVTAGGKMLLDGIGGIQCALDALVPRVTPSSRYVYPEPQRPTTYAAPCAPTYAAPPPLPVPTPSATAPCGR